MKVEPFTHLYTSTKGEGILVFSEHGDIGTMRVPKEQANAYKKIKIIKVFELKDNDKAGIQEETKAV